MKNDVLNFNETEIKFSFLRDNNDNWLHFFYTIIPQKPEQIVDQINTIEQAEAELYRKYKIDNKCSVVKRFFLVTLLITTMKLLITKKDKIQIFLFL